MKRFEKNPKKPAKGRVYSRRRSPSPDTECSSSGRRTRTVSRSGVENYERSRSSHSGYWADDNTSRSQESERQRKRSLSRHRERCNRESHQHFGVRRRLRSLARAGSRGASRSERRTYNQPDEARCYEQEGARPRSSHVRFDDEEEDEQEYLSAEDQFSCSETDEDELVEDMRSLSLRRSDSESEFDDNLLELPEEEEKSRERNSSQKTSLGSGQSLRSQLSQRQSSLHDDDDEIIIEREVFRPVGSHGEVLGRQEICLRCRQFRKPGHRCSRSYQGPRPNLPSFSAHIDPENVEPRQRSRRDDQEGQNPTRRSRRRFGDVLSTKKKFFR